MINARQVAEVLGGPRVLKGRLATLDDLRERLRSGLPYASLEAVTSAFGIERHEVLGVLHLPPRTLARRKKEKRFQPDESDRLFRLGRIAALAEDVLGSREKAAGWLRRSNRALGDEAPLRQLDTDLGVRRVEEVLLRIAHGVYS